MIRVEIEVLSIGIFQTGFHGTGFFIEEIFSAVDILLPAVKTFSGSIGIITLAVCCDPAGLKNTVLVEVVIIGIDVVPAVFGTPSILWIEVVLADFIRVAGF